jgi:glyoxylase-like metal-dependent hydrolase (beta-lactamase superfamily II)/ferredoxin
MANVELRLPENVPGDFFVDSTCIDCDTCSQLAPAVFRDHGDQCSVYHQPTTADETKFALMSLVACPTGSIGTTKKHDARLGINAFPLHLDENVYFCGFTSESSFGGWSYLITRPESEGGNILIDSPRFATQLIKHVAALGGVKRMLLTHKDDIADHELFKERFDCTRIMHAEDGARRLRIERVLEGQEPLELDNDIIAIPTPGHTRGHVVYLYRNKFLFTGDHLAWSPNRQTLTAFRSVAWYSWPEQIRSMAKLLDYEFEWVLPGHGDMYRADARTMHRELERCVAWMKTK